MTMTLGDAGALFTSDGADLDAVIRRLGGPERLAWICVGFPRPDPRRP